jgi:hypothetical protein
MGGGRAGGASKDETKVTKMDLWDLLPPSRSMAMFQCCRLVARGLRIEIGEAP